MKPDEHEAEAVRLLEYAETFSLASPARADALRFAQVHATLSLRLSEVENVTEVRNWGGDVIVTIPDPEPEPAPEPEPEPKPKPRRKPGPKPKPKTDTSTEETKA